MTAPTIERLDVAETIASSVDLTRLTQYFDLLMAENAHVNLVSRETSRDDFDRMVAESLFGLQLVDQPVRSYLDIGSGGGLPAIPILLTGRVAGPVWLVERTQKKTVSLGRMLRSLGLQAHTFAKTFEEVKLSERFNLVTLRYVKLTPQLLRRILPALAPEGCLVYYSRPEFELDDIRANIHNYQISTESFVKSVTVFHR